MNVTDAILFRAATDDENLLCMQSNYRVQASVLRAMQTCDKLCDVSLFGVPPLSIQASELRPIRAHKAVLAQASRYFYELFTNDDDYTDSHQAEHHLENVSHENLRLIIDFVYTDMIKIVKQEAVNVLRDVLTGAKRLLMTELADACEQYLAGDSQIKLDNCISLWCFARKYSCLTLMHATSTFIADNLAGMPRNVNFLSMPYTDCAKLLMSEAFVAADDDRRCIAAIAWLNHGGVDSRALYVHDILNMIPLTPGSVSNDTVLEASRCGMIWNYSPELVRDLLAGAVTFQSKLPKPSASQSASLIDDCRNRVGTNGIWYVMGGEESPKLFLSYDTNRRLWTRLPPLPRGMSKAGACAVGGRLVMMGGYACAKSYADIYEYDLAVETWSDGPTGKLREGRSGLAACSDGRYVYAIGGDSDDYYSTNLVEQYVPESKEAERGSDLISPRYAPAAVFSSKHNCIFTVAGESNSGQCIKSIEKYHVLLNTSSLAGQMTNGRYGGAAALSGDDLYIAGGCDDKGSLKCVEVFNMRTGRVRKALDMVEYHRNCHAATIYDGNVICVLGGWYSLSVETYDVREGKWSNTGIIVPDMPESTSGFAFAVV